MCNVDSEPLSVRYTGPHKIIKHTSPVDYLVKFSNSGVKKKLRTVHFNVLRKYYIRTEYVNVIVTPENQLQCSENNVSSDNSTPIPDYVVDSLVKGR